MSSKPADLMAWTETLLPNILEDEESWNHAYVGDAAKVSRIAEYCPSLRLDDIELSFVDNKQSSKRSNGQLTETWCFWRDLWNVENGKAQMSELVYLDCASFEQDFTNLQQSISIDTLSPHASGHIFRQGIRPAYQDPANRSGGHWRIGATNSQSADALWQRLATAVIQDEFPNEAGLCGMTLMRKQRGRFALRVWFNSCANESVKAAKAFLGGALNKSDYTGIKFCPHKYILQTLRLQEKSGAVAGIPAECIEPSEKPSALKAPSRPQSAWGKPKHPTPKQNKSAPCASQASVSRKGSPLSKPASAPANAMPPLPLSAESVPEALVVPFIVPPAKSPTLTPAPTSEQGLPFRILYESLQQLQSVQCQSSGQPDS
eukprot:CAMPEP_0174328976 /NCGR_PEP_ID=MMETSP0810-20121108/15513_1 /TAXON_ID=73025 ORGANISM="Eutreptiella gymnastica-like, Strain CCMP1594" /NCGR_SAMPLE_ID=MMETSP0810 /ASSEMBLY_ACC=CAM_ASM_000659 /LENGTH=374 /DNA_ID=CAMNT_0015443277 /DNA_START=27 /DNA_END=1148 /DNA_ORIENTATION=+